MYHKRTNMNELNENEREELQHFINILYSFMSYKRDGSVEVERVYRSYNLLSEDDKKLLIESPAAKSIKMLKAIITNQNFIISMVSGIINFDNYEGKLDKLYLENENKYTNEDVIRELRIIVKNTSFCNTPENLDDSEINPTTDPVVLHRNGNWVRTTLRQFVRDWSDEGEYERNQCFKPLLDALKRKLPIRDPKNPPLILCPGCGLGRLPFEVLRLGYSSQGNEFSYFMLIGSNFIINHSIKPRTFKIFPYCLDTSNRISNDDHLKEVYIPDVSPSSFNFESHNFSICAGEFTEAYDDFFEYFDGILTCFFLDTAKNVISYIRTIAKIIKKGGLWANIGPLLYHYADLTHNSIELAWNEIEKIISNWFTIENVEIKDANYTSNSLSMMKTQYKCIYFEAIRNDVEVFGKSITF
uniref:carnosine N-methyltransferase n=1 Tax=Theileria annulata TaxID=5874 RepID=A0A3B0MWA4_THEAN